jgi:hypothetical protein
MLGLAVVGWLYGSLIHSLFADLRRMLFPWCADSIAIPIFEFGIISIIASPLLALIGWAITRKFGELPARLGEWNAERPALSLVVSITFAATMVGALWLLVECLPTSASVSAPAWIMAIYLLASTRAALLSRRSPERSAS